jgi:hypothetical protein
MGKMGELLPKATTCYGIWLHNIYGIGTTPRLW